jgi:hypothetical protein
MKPREPEVGDVYAVPLADGRFGAVRVFRRQDRSSLLATTEFLGAEPPTIDEPALRRTVVRRRFRYQDSPAVCWHDGRPPKSHLLIGSLPPSRQDLDLPGANTHGGGWHVNVANDVLLEWRWEHEREALVREVERERIEFAARRRAEAMKAVKAPPLAKQEAFWQVIALLDWNQTIDDAIVAPAVAGLASTGVAAIKDFHASMAYFLYQLDGEKYARELGEYAYRGEGDHLSVDNFLYARCFVVARGRAEYQRVLADPAAWPRDRDLEALLTIAPAAYERRTGKELESDPPISYETFSNGAGWAVSK